MFFSHSVGVTSSHPDTNAQIINNLKKSTHYSHNLLSYDGRTGEKHFGKPLPEALNLTRIEIDAGRSSIATPLNRVENTYEALYISPSLMNKITIKPNQVGLQTSLF